GYIFNRNAEAPEPFIQLFDEQGDGPLTIPYRDIATIRFTGKDTAAGNSWKAWVERKEKGKALRGAASGADRLGRDPDPHGGGARARGLGPGALPAAPAVPAVSRLSLRPRVHRAGRRGRLAAEGALADPRARGRSASRRIRRRLRRPRSHPGR